jgi:sugar lactone lactonase YvrE
MDFRKKEPSGRGWPEIARLGRWNPPMSFRSIAGRLGMSVGGVQGAGAGRESLDPEVPGEWDSVLAKYGGGGLAVEAAQAAADCERLNDLELHRLLGLPVGSGGWGRARRLVVIAAIVVLVGAGITGYLVFNRQPVRPFDPASLPQTETPSALVPPGPRPTALSITGLRNPEGVAVDAAGDVYVADHGNRVVRWSAASSNQTVLAFTGLNHPGAVAVDVAGDVYVADWGNSRVLRWSTRSNTQIELPFHDLDHPGGLAVDTAGDVYVADSKNRVVALTAGSTTQTELPFTGLSRPHGVAVDTVGDVYVTDYYNNRVVEWATRSNTQTVLPLIGLSKPLDVAVDTAGNLYVTFNGNNRVLKLPMH